MCAEIQHQDRRKFIPTPLHPKSPVPADIEIAQAAELKPIRQVAEEMGLEECELELYGDYKAKIKLEVLDRLADAPDGKYIDVTAITPTPLGTTMRKARAATLVMTTTEARSAKSRN